MQSLNLGGSKNSQSPASIRRINRLPIAVIIVLLVLFLAIIFYGLASRGLYFGRDGGPDTSSGNPASTYADQIKRGVTDGIIGEPQQQTTFQPTPVETKQADEKSANPFTPQPEQQTVQRQAQELEAEAVWRARLAREQQEQILREQQRQRMARLQASNAAYDAPLAIDRGKLRSGETNDVTADAATRPTTTTRDIAGTSDLYAAALRAGLGGQNTDPNGQASKEDFFNADLKDLGYLPNRVVPQQSPFELKRGSVMRTGWFRQVHVKSRQCRLWRSLLVARRTVMNEMRSIENVVRAILREGGIKLGTPSRADFAGKARQMTAGDALVTALVEPLLAVLATMMEQFARLTKQVLEVAKGEMTCRLLMSVPGVGPITALAFRATIDRADRFRRSRDVGAHLGLTPSRYQSGETDIQGRISRCGDEIARTALYEAAHCLLVRSKKWSSLRAWGMGIAKRRGMARARVAVARKLAVILHRMWCDGSEFRFGKQPGINLDLAAA